MAALSSDRKMLAVSVVNPTESAQEFDLSIAGVQLGGTGKLWQIAAPNVDAANMPGEKPAVEIVETTLKEIPQTFTAPRLSINVYEFELR